MQIPGLWGEWINDDLLLFAQSDLYTSPARLGEALTSTLGKGTSYWRPVVKLSFFVDAQVGGVSPTAFRLTNMLLHAVASMLALVALRRILPGGWALGAALVWAVHPVGAEAVTWPSGRFDVMASLFVLAALAIVPKEPLGTSPMRLAGIAACTALATGSKELAVTAPLLLWLWSTALATETGTPWKRALRATWRIPVAAAAGVMLTVLLRYEIIGFILGPGTAMPSEMGDPVSRALLVGRSVATHSTSFLFPWSNVGPAHPCPWPIPPGDPHGWAGLALFAGVVACAVLGLRRRPGHGLILWATMAAAAPVSQLQPLLVMGGVHAADRFLYLPSFFAIAAAALALRSLAQARSLEPRRLAIGAALLIALLAVYRLAFIVPRWHTERDYWTWCHEMAPSSFFALSGMYGVEVAEGRFDEAERYARRIAEEHADHGGEEYLIDLLALRNRTVRALEALDAALATRPDDSMLLLRRGEALLRAGRLAEAVADLDRAVRIEDANTDGDMRSQLAAVLASSAAALAVSGENPALARDRLTRARAVVEMHDANAWLRILRASLALGDVEGADVALGRIGNVAQPELVMIWRLAAAKAPGTQVARRLAELVVTRAREAVERSPESAPARDRLAFVLIESGDVAGAERELRKALELDPGFAQARFHLGLWLQRAGRTDEARAELERAREDAEAGEATDLVHRIEQVLGSL